MSKKDSKKSDTSASGAVPHADDALVVEPQHEEGFGDKSIGFWGSVCLLANNITGPGMVQIPVLFQQAGWLIPTIFFGYIGILAGLTSLFLAKAVSQIPGNKYLAERMEFSNLGKLLFPRWLYLVSFFALIFNFQVSNMSSIVVSAQTMDATLLASVKTTCALVIWDPDGFLAPAAAVNSTGPPPSASVFTCVSADASVGGSDSAFGSAYVISLGYLITMAITVPLGYLNLDDNIWVQYGGFILLLLCIIAWVVQFGISGVDVSRMPAIQWSGMGTVIPTVVFNWGFLTTLPSWLNEKSPNVSVAKATWTSIVISGVMFILLGVLGGLALDYPSGEDLLAAIDDPSTPNVLTIAKIATYVFPSAALLSGIPVFSIIIRYNILENQIMNKFWANIFAVVFPWVVSLLFYAGNSLGVLINWSSAILFVGLNFVMPLKLYIAINTESGREHLLEKMRAEGMLKDTNVEEYTEHLHHIQHPNSSGGDEGEEVKSVNKQQQQQRGGGGGGGNDADNGVEMSPSIQQKESKKQTKTDADAAWGLGAVRNLRFVMAGAEHTLVEEGVDKPLLGSGSNSTRSSSVHHHDHHAEGHGDHIYAPAPVKVDSVDWSGSDDISELPSWWCLCCGGTREKTAHVTASIWFWSSAAIAIICVILQILVTADPSFADGA